MRPLLDVTREETSAYCAEHGLAVRIDATNPDTTRGLIRDEILPLLRRLHPGADANLRALGEERPRLPRGRSRRRSSTCSPRAPARRPPTSAAAFAPCASTGRSGSRGRWSGGRGRSRPSATVSRCGRADRGIIWQGRRKKVQDLFVDAKVPRAERDAWPVVVCGDEVVAVPGIADAPGWAGVVTARRIAS